MIEKILDFSQEPVSLKIKYQQLVIIKDNHPDITIPINEIAVIIASHPQISYTNAVLASLAENGGIFIICDKKYLPIAMTLPLQSHYIQTQRFLLQANVSLPTRKQLWKQIVQAKVKNQGKLLYKLYGNDQGLLKMAHRVRSGDQDNIEAQASRRYWTTLFNDPSFKRNPQKQDQNRFLNYGYAVLRAIVSRAICSAGLHPSLGLHHHNQYNPFCLADDLMEPFRPFIDRAVVELLKKYPEDHPLDPELKKQILSAITEKININQEKRTIFDSATKTANSLVKVYEGKEKKLILPEL